MGDANNGAGAATEEAVDISVLDQYRDLQDEGDPDIVTELIDTYFGDVPTRFNNIREAVTSANATQLEREAHNLKGSSANLGAGPLAIICSELEQMGRNNSMDGAEAVIEQLENEFERVRKSLEKERQA